MGAKFDVDKVINKLIDYTKRAVLAWEYADLDASISSIVFGLLLRDYDIHRNCTFVCKSGSGRFVLAQASEDTDTIPLLFLIVIPGTGSRDNQILNDYGKYQVELLRLQNLVKKQHPNTEDFILDFLNG